MPRFVNIEQLQGFQDLHKGVPCGKISAFFGPPSAGKSTLVGTLGVEVALKEDGDLLVFDTENSGDTYDAWKEAWEERFDVDINIIEMRAHISSNHQKSNRKYDVGWTVINGEASKEALNLYILSCPDIQDILIALGRGMEMKISDNAESGKFTALPQADAWARHIEDAPFFEFIKGQNIKCLIFDSLTNPLDELTAVTQNFPARTDLTQAWMIQIHKMAAVLDMPVLMTLHESRNEAGAFSKELKVQGGKGVLYNVKYVTYLLNKNEKGVLPSAAKKPSKNVLGNQNARAAWVSRHPYKEPWKDLVYFELTDQGIIDLEE